MIILIEGIDRVGKTTLANILNKQFNIPIFKDKPIYNKDFKNHEITTEKGNLLYSLMESGGIDNLIMDRGHLTEYVYGKIERNYSNNYIINEFDEQLARVEKQGRLILVYVKPESLEWSSAQHGSDLTPHHELMEECIKNSKIKNIMVTSFTQLDKTVLDIKKRIENRYE